MGRRRRWYWTQNGIKPNGTVNGETSPADLVNAVCVNGASPVAASEPVAVQGCWVNHGYESTTRMGEKPATPPSTAAVVNGNGTSPLSSEGGSTSSDTANLSNCSTSSDPVTPMTTNPAGPKKRWRNKYRNKVLENPAVHVAPRSNGIQEVAETIYHSQSYGNGTSSRSSEPDSTNSDAAAWSYRWGSEWVAPSRNKWRDRLNNRCKKKKMNVSEPEYPAFPVPIAPRLEEEEDWSDEIEEFTRTVNESFPYGPEDILTHELQGLRVYQNTSPNPGGMGNYVPGSHHRRPIRWTCISISPTAELDQFADA